MGVRATDNCGRKLASAKPVHAVLQCMATPDQTGFTVQVSAANEVRNTNAAGRLLRVQEVSEILQVPVSWVYDHTRRGCRDPLPYLKLGKYVRFQAAAVQSYLEEMRSRNAR